eukprot:scaffold320875_cov19-Tisochrysis_lutea.AAC.1
MRVRDCVSAGLHMQECETCIRNAHVAALEHQNTKGLIPFAGLCTKPEKKHKGGAGFLKQIIFMK